jgi:magnesium chelatase subunit D
VRSPDALDVFAVDPPGFGGLLVRGPPGPARDALLERLRALAGPLRRIPHHVSDDRLLGGLDLAATLRAGRRVAQAGALASAHGGVLVIATSERLAPATAAVIGRALDTGEVILERDGLAGRAQARFGLVLFDEGIDDEATPAVLTERCAFILSADACSRAQGLPAGSPDDVRAARARLRGVALSPALRRALCAAALACGADSLRVSLQAARAARAIAALDGRRRVADADAARAAELVIAPRATRWPDPAREPDEPGAEAPPPATPDTSENGEDATDQRMTLDDVILRATRAALPDDVLALLGAEMPRRTVSTARGASRAGPAQRSRRRGRPIGARPGHPRDGARLHVVETLRAAAPWQALRRRERAARGRLDVRSDDLRVRRFRERRATTLVFVVDASGSAALHRLAEVKGAIELMLAQCYVRRDQVALVTFRGRAAEIVLPPTRSVSRARRALAGLPGGGGTPLAAGLAAAGTLVLQVRRRGDRARVIVLTDGRANVARDGTGGRTQATRDASAAARSLAGHRVPTLLIDASPEAHPAAEALARELRARYLPLPHADARALARRVADDWRSEEGGLL